MASTIADQLAQVEQQIADLTELYNTYSEEFNTRYSYYGNYTDPRAVQLTSLREQTLARIEEAKKVRSRLQAEQTSYNQALADAARNGLSGDAAEAAALAQVERAKGTRNILTIAGIALLIVLLFVAVKWYLKNKR